MGGLARRRPVPASLRAALPRRRRARRAACAARWPPRFHGTTLMDPFSVALPFLRLLDAESAHRATIVGLKLLPRRTPEKDDPRLAVSAFGLDFPNPIGLAAGFDKDAKVPDAMLGFGFGFEEVGTLTPRAQPGNPRPRAFRLLEDRAVINRYGFNNDGHAPALALLSRRKREGIVGVNVGANK